MTIKPIETVYNGYRFRSRLEARWAVFFDTLGVKWEYEKEGYDLDGVWYLPDFWLPDHLCWIEIKGQEPTRDEKEKVAALAMDTKKNAYLFYGEIPMPDSYGGMSPSNESAYKFFAEGMCDMPYWWCECPDCGYFGIEWAGCSDRLDCKQCKICYLIEHRKTCRFWHHPQKSPIGLIVQGCFQCSGEDVYVVCPYHGNERNKGCPLHSAKMSKHYNHNTVKLITAYTAARQARFEHSH